MFSSKGMFKQQFVVKSPRTLLNRQQKGKLKRNKKLTWTCELCFTRLRAAVTISGINLEQGCSFQMKHKKIKGEDQKVNYLSACFRCRVTIAQKISKHLFPIFILSKMLSSEDSVSKFNEPRRRKKSLHHKCNVGPKADGMYDLTYTTNQPRSFL